MYLNITYIIQIMDKRLNRQLETYISKFKNAIKNKVLELKIEQSHATQLMEFVYEYDRLVFSKEDVSKRKRIKNSIPQTNRCHAKRATGEQCTRKQKDGHLYCGTHVKGTPHGIISTEEGDTDQIKSEVFAEEIYGIVYYLDKFGNVFSTEDVLNGKENPQVIAKYILQNEVYTIPSFGLS